LNNYGAKPNSELILGYGFSLEGNPDDTIVLSIGGGPTTSALNSGEKQRWEVGRGTRGVEGVWHHVLDVISSASRSEEAEESAITRFENQLDAASMLLEMCQSYLRRLPQIPNVSDAPTLETRPEVLAMFTHYVEGAGYFSRISLPLLMLLYFRSTGHFGIDSEICRGEGGGSGGGSSKTRH